MTKFYFTIALSFIHWSILSQSLQQEINDHVWKVQLEAMNENNVDKFMSVMSDDVVQISYNRGSIRNKDEFRKQAEETYKRIKERKLTRKMEFRFLNRIANSTSAFEDGFFKYEIINEKLEKREFYGYFQVTLRKEGATWKVLVDYDADNYNNAPVTTEMFNKAKALEMIDTR